MPILSRLCALFGLDLVDLAAGDLMEDGYLDGSTMAHARRAIEDLLTVLRCDVVPLVDAFNFSDYMLHSCIGREDGQASHHHATITIYSVPHSLSGAVRPFLRPLDWQLLLLASTTAYCMAARALLFSCPSVLHTSATPQVYDALWEHAQRATAYLCEGGPDGCVDGWREGIAPGTSAAVGTCTAAGSPDSSSRARL